MNKNRKNKCKTRSVCYTIFTYLTAFLLAPKRWNIVTLVTAIRLDKSQATVNSCVC